jgi:hypothetical protein
MKNPNPNQECESCGKKDCVSLMDVQVKLTEKWPKGKWLYLCFLCYEIYKLEKPSPETLTVYQKFNGRYFEVKNVDQNSNNL